MRRCRGHLFSTSPTHQTVLTVFFFKYFFSRNLVVSGGALRFGADPDMLVYFFPAFPSVGQNGARNVFTLVNRGNQELSQSHTYRCLDDPLGVLTIQYRSACQRIGLPPKSKHIGVKSEGIPSPIYAPQTPVMAVTTSSSPTMRTIQLISGSRNTVVKSSQPRTSGCAAGHCSCRKMGHFRGKERIQKVIFRFLV